ncbi:hypothetical protein [Streptomyces sp. S.PB5]|uniref:arsenate-mycothiol transferase ArsC n=1 Tax=Streptomyces sp. S.PB5 TaxID=3020844 RepID=UPI0025B07110|nr:hypothetical protein [Streptomyces sp. S.PB5]MDN3027844.1 hypothetical protein [Streptomyces sp. S.PB5]
MSDQESLPSVLFVCARNAGRSQIAAALFEDLADGRATVRSGGPTPGEQVNPVVVQAMAEIGIGLAARTPRRLTDSDVRGSSVVVTTSGADAVGPLPGQRHEDWPVEDVADKDVDEVRVIRDDIRSRVERLAADLLPPVKPADA